MVSGGDRICKMYGLAKPKATVTIDVILSGRTKQAIYSQGFASSDSGDFTKLLLRGNVSDCFEIF